MKFYHVRYLLAFAAVGLALNASAANNPFLGSWELTIPGGGAGWLGIEQDGGSLKSKILWGGGSVLPTDSTRLEDGKLVVTRNHVSQRKDASGKTVKKTTVETITATLDGDKLNLVTATPKESGDGENRATFSGRRTPPMPPAPNLKKVKFSKAIKLFTGKSLEGWRLTDPNAVNGWSVQKGILVNNPVQEEGKPHKNYGNLRTDAEFEDFNLKVTFSVPKGGNSGIYLRGIYEVQVADSYGQAPEAHRVGAIYSRITPTANPAKPAGEWQEFDITLVDRHVTVVLNSQKIIDNQPIEGCTGGALWSDVTRPGPIYIQGDHTGVSYKSLVLRPVSRK